MWGIEARNLFAIDSLRAPHQEKVQNHSSLLLISGHIKMGVLQSANIVGLKGSYLLDHVFYIL